MTNTNKRPQPGDSVSVTRGGPSPGTALSSPPRTFTDELDLPGARYHALLGIGYAFVAAACVCALCVGGGVA